MAQPPEIRVTKATGSKYLTQTATMLADAFSADPLIHYFLNCAPSPGVENAHRHRFYYFICLAAAFGDAIFYEASSETSQLPATSSTSQSLPKGEEEENASGELNMHGEPDFHCTAIIMPPGRTIDDLSPLSWLKLLFAGVLKLLASLGPTSFLRVLVEYPAIPEPAKHATFAPAETYFYVAMLGTDAKHRGKGLGSQLIGELKRDAQTAGKPIWLEATTERSRAVYAKCGFGDVETEETVEGGGLVVGRGKCDGRGNACKGGGAGGLKIWPMVWWPEGYVNGGKKDLGDVREW
ncbi:hypothetical protein K505DRAFT_343728 [Melanomma pulvis-pyrius CBS 109.77]|uniref:N-acetyltransferase domain-containing protein n=1 Tax=Melanomma pulvis-pyrius CBS 109.77 TaxID=1314802 RepID=A0A6A6WRH2_9PLEO|nr:hypothetical protein K505DRAFT_343728 [Melanomma pulvis-pyrius CBS 109.77]